GPRGGLDVGPLPATTMRNAAYLPRPQQLMTYRRERTASPALWGVAARRRRPSSGMRGARARAYRAPVPPRTDRQGSPVSGRDGAPAAEPHHPGADARRHLVPLAHVILGDLIVPPVLDETSDRDSVPDERDVEDREPDRREPERALGEGLTGERAADDPREDAPAEAGGEQRPTADDHHVRTRKVADEMSRVAHARERLRDPGHVLHDHVQ